MCQGVGDGGKVMSDQKRYRVLLALVDSGATLFFEQLFRQHNDLKLQVEVLDDPYSIVERCLELVPDLLIVAPQIICDPLLPLFRERIGRNDLPVVAYCSTLIESEMTKHFDGKLLTTDGASEVLNVLENVLDVERMDESEMVLTPREQEVVVAVVKGMTNKEIAESFYLSTHTVITHRRNIARKLNIHSPSGLTIYAIMNKLVTLDDIKEQL